MWPHLPARGTEPLCYSPGHLAKVCWLPLKQSWVGWLCGTHITSYSFGWIRGGEALPFLQTPSSLQLPGCSLPILGAVLVVVERVRAFGAQARLHPVAQKEQDGGQWAPGLQGRTGPCTPWTHRVAGILCGEARALRLKLGFDLGPTPRRKAQQRTAVGARFPGRSQAPRPF